MQDSIESSEMSLLVQGRGPLCAATSNNEARRLQEFFILEVILVRTVPQNSFIDWSLHCLSALVRHLWLKGEGGGGMLIVSAICAIDNSLL